MKNSRLFVSALTIIVVLCMKIPVTCAVEPQITAGERFTIALKSNGTLWAWGHNGHGTLGIGDPTVENSSTPVQIGADTDWDAITSGSHFSIARKTNGTLWAWGFNGAMCAMGLDSTVADSYTPVQIGSDTNWKAIVAGWAFTIALKTDGTLWHWGSNYYGQRGDGTIDGGMTCHTPHQIGFDTDWAAVIAGAAHIIAFKTDGSRWVWGNGGMLGDGSTGGRLSPYKIPGSESENWTSMTTTKTGAYHTLLSKTDGTLWSCGTNGRGELGIGTADEGPHPTPVQVHTGANWTTMTAGGHYHNVARKADGTLWAWGYNGYGQLGSGHTSDQHAPVQIGSDTNWTTVTAGYWHSLAMKSDGTLWAWGHNFYGQLGDGTNIDRHIPVQVITLLTHTLTVITNGTGTGTVSGAGTYDHGTTRQLHANASSDSIFTGWSGDCSGTTTPLDVLIDMDKTCIATFQKKFPWVMFLPALTRSSVAP